MSDGTCGGETDNSPGGTYNSTLLSLTLSIGEEFLDMHPFGCTPFPPTPGTQRFPPVACRDFHVSDRSVVEVSET